MPFAAALSTHPDAMPALDEVCGVVAGQLTQPDLVIAFFSPHHAARARDLAATLQGRLAPKALLGCMGEAIIGNGREVENQPALSLWAAKWATPGVTVEPFMLELERTGEGPSLLGWPDALVEVDPKTSALLLLGDPFTFPTDYFLERVNEDYPGLRVVGGMSSGMTNRDQSRLLLGGSVKTSGAVAVLLQGDTGLRPIVSQGCRPVGRHMVITKAQESVIFELGGKPPLVQLQDLWQALDGRDRELMRQGLHVGRVINEFLSDFQRGDFLVRNVRGIDQATGAMEITDHVRVGQTVQFHVRDATTAGEDLHALLQMDVVAHEKKPAAALVFSCNGRGTRLFAEPDHDARAVQSEAGAVPVAGFFAAGELGPVGGQNFIHGFTASVALFEE